MKLTQISLLAALAISGAVAGGNVEKVEVAVVEEVLSNWDFSGQAALYYQTMDKNGAVDLFSQESARANAGLQLNAVGKFDYGLSVGAQVTGLGTLGLQNSVVSNIMQSADGNLNGGAVTKLYMAWSGEANTIKIGRQELPKSLSPFAWSEGWNVFKNTYEAALYVNTMIPSTVLVGAWVNGANQNGVGAWDGNGNWLMNNGGSNFNEFNDVNGDDGIFMLTAQNKSINGLTITASAYYGANLLDNMNNKDADLNGLPYPVGTGDATTIFWGDVAYANADFPVTFAAQGGQVDVGNGTNSTTAFGAKIGGHFGAFGLLAAYSSVDDGTTGVFNVGGVKTPLYTQMILNQGAIASNADTILIKATAKALGGKFIAQYGMTTENDRDLAGTIGSIDYNEFNFIYKTKVWDDSITLLAAYINQDLSDKVIVDDNGDSTLTSPSANNVIRFWARYNF